MALSFPTSPTAGQQYIAPNGITYTWNATLSTWTSTGVSGAGGGGGGAVSSVTASAPLASSGGANPNITATLATGAQAAAGTSNVVLSTPEFTVPKDTAGMAGAVLLPKGGNYGGSTSGMFRFNTTSNHVEFYDGTAWQTSVNRSGDTMTGTLNMGTVASGVVNGSAWAGTASGNTQGGTLGFQAGGYISLSRGGSSPIGLNRTDGVGQFITFFDANVFSGFIGKNAVNWFCYQIDVGPMMLQATSNVLYIQGNNAGGPVTFRDGGGNPIAFISNAGVFTTISDASLKVDIEPLSYGLAEVAQLEPKTYKLKTQVEDDHGDAPTQIGLLAQEVASVIPEVVDYREDEKGETVCSIAYTELIPVLVNAIKELKQEFDDYKATHP